MYATRSRKVKTDRRDARTLAEACKLGAYRAAHRTSDKQRLVKAQLSVREALVQTRTRNISLVGAELRQHGFRVACGQTASFAKRVQQLSLPGRLQSSIAPLLAVLLSVNDQLARVDGRLAQLAEEDETLARLRSAPSVGPVTAAAFASTIDDVHRFRRSQRRQRRPHKPNRVCNGLIDSARRPSGKTKRRVSANQVLGCNREPHRRKRPRPSNPTMRRREFTPKSILARPIGRSERFIGGAIEREPSHVQSRIGPRASPRPQFVHSAVFLGRANGKPTGPSNRQNVGWAGLTRSRRRRSEASHLCERAAANSDRRRVVRDARARRRRSADKPRHRRRRGKIPR